MRKLVALGLGVTLAASLATSAFAGPTRAIVQELGAVQPAGGISIDLLGLSTVTAPAIPAGFPALALTQLKLTKTFQANVGAFGGEARISNNSIGYKAAIPMVAGLAGYGEVAYASGNPTPAAAAGTLTGATQITIGAAYTTNLGPAIVNLNPEYVSISQSGLAAGAQYNNSVTNINAAVLFPVTPQIILGAEYLYSSYGYAQTAGAGTVSSVGTLALGARYAPTANVTVDLAFYANANANVNGNVGAQPAYGVTGTPVVAKVNLAF